MANELALTQEKLMGVLQTSIYPGASQASINMVLDYCKARKLDPLQKPVHIVPMWDSKSHTTRDVVMPGLNLYRTQAAQSGQLAGISEPEFGESKDFNFGGHKMHAPEWCKVTVKRLMINGTLAEFTAVEYLDEAISTGKAGDPTPMWKKRPRGMLAKTAESQALRKAFPDINAAESAEEMDGKSYFAEEAEAKAADNPIVIAAKEIAQKGSEAFKEYWKFLEPADRAAVKPAMEEIKAICAEADKNTVTVEG